MSHSGDDIFLIIGYLIIFIIVYSMGLSLIETIVAFVTGGIILLIINYLTEGPNLKIVRSSRQLEREKPLTYRHVIVIRNKGKISGQLINIIVEPKEVKQSLIWDFDENRERTAPISIDDRKTKTIALNCFPSSKNKKYSVTVTYEKSFLRKISEKPKTIWGSV